MGPIVLLTFFAIISVNVGGGAYVCIQSEECMHKCVPVQVTICSCKPVEAIECPALSLSTMFP